MSGLTIVVGTYLQIKIITVLFLMLFNVESQKYLLTFTRTVLNVFNY